MFPKHIVAYEFFYFRTYALLPAGPIRCGRRRALDPARCCGRAPRTARRVLPSVPLSSLSVINIYNLPCSPQLATGVNRF